MGVLSVIEKHVPQLLALAESGFGYQNLIGASSSGEMERYVGFNAEILIPVVELREVVREFDSYEALVEKGPSGNSQSIESFVFVGSDPDGPAEVSEADDDSQSVPPLEGQGGLDELFYRFTAFRNDRRVTRERGLVRGTFVTTEHDVSMVPSGLAAVARYALPLSYPAIYMRSIRASEAQVRYGTVTPAFGQSGGGVEALFTHGTPRDTVMGPVVIPER